MSFLRAVRLTASGFRNLAPLDIALPRNGAVFLGPNGHGKTNLLEALSYPVLFRSLRGAPDADVVGFGEPAFHVCLTIAGGIRRDHAIDAGYARDGKQKRVAVDGVERPRITDALGTWLAAAFLPADVRLVSGGASERRHFLDRLLSLADHEYLRAARSYRAALKQRNRALRLGRGEVAAAFDRPLARAGAWLVRQRLEWIARYASRWSELSGELGEPTATALEYRGNPALADADAWPEALEASSGRDRAAGATMIGPHRDDLILRLDGAPFRSFGSTGQHRTAALALVLCEWETLAERTGIEPALVLDDVFAELDRDRQDRLAQALRIGTRQVFLSAPRAEELPSRLDLPRFTILDGRISPESGLAVA